MTFIGLPLVGQKTNCQHQVDQIVKPREFELIWLQKWDRMLAQQYAGSSIRANTVVPGLIDTPRIATTVAKMFSENSLEEAKAARARQVPMGRMGTAWEVAHACAFLASDAAAYVTGTELVVDGGITGKLV